MTVGDLIKLPPIKTVVQLQDTRDPVLRDQLVDNFVLTEEVSAGLSVILQKILSTEGAGFFLKGHYGSGKSHFLAYLSLILSEPGYFQNFLDHFSSSRPAAKPELERAGERRIAVVEVSLVDYRSALHLEDIVGSALQSTFPGLFEEAGVENPSVWKALLGPHQERLVGFLKSRGIEEQQFWESEDEIRAFAHQTGVPLPLRGTRREVLDQVFDRLPSEGFEGLLVVIDELSEFLRSKPSPRDFNEDVRYLQFLGEYSSEKPLWVVAALQEYIEETGEIRQEQFNKIKDRYPVRIVLSASHVKSLVGRLLVQKTAEAAQPLKQLYQTFTASFPSWTVPEDEFYELYPLHPASIELLEDLKPLFSKTRGFVDFIHYQIKGDPGRAIPGLLDAPHETLLCPDRIFDHFLDRMRSIIEIQPYLETVYAHYRKEMPRLFDDPQDRDFSLRFLKLLILQHVSPLPHRFNVQELTEMLLERVTEMDPEVNYQYTADIAEQLVRRGGFVIESSEPDASLKARTFEIRFEANVNFIVERKLEHKKQALGALGRQVFTSLIPPLFAEWPFFREIAPGGEEVLVVDWQNTRRSGKVCVAFRETGGGPSEPAGGEMLDFRLAVLLPGQPFEAASDCRLKSSHCAGVLVPSEVDDLGLCLEVLSLFELREEYRQDRSSQGRRLQQRVESLIEARLPRVGALYERAYRQSALHAPSGEPLFGFDDLRGATCLELIQQVVSQLLDTRFPKHYLVAPRQNYYPKAALSEVGHYFLSMSDETFERLGWGRTVLEGFLLPTGLLKRRGKEYRFCSGGDECAPLGMLLDYLERQGSCSARKALRVLTDSEFGMSELQFRAFLWAALLGGFLIAARNGRKTPLSQLDPERLLEIEELRPGETVSRQATQFLQQLDFLPEKLRKPSLSYAECRRCWEAVLELYRNTEEKISGLERLLVRYREYRVFRLLDGGELSGVIEGARAFLGAVRLSAPAVEGLESLAGASLDPQLLSRQLSALSNAFVFFAEHFASFSFLGSYLQRARTSIPGQARYSPMAEDLEGLWRRLKGWNPCSELGPYQTLQKDFENWQRLYITLYEEEHDRFHRSPKLGQLQQILVSPEIKLLERLDGLQLLISEASARAVRESVATALAQGCNRVVWEELQQRPICSCGFELGKSPALPQAQPLLEKLQAQLAQFVDQIRHPRFQELLDRFEFHLSRRSEELGPSGPDLLKSVQALKGAQSPDELLAVGDRLSIELVERLNSFEPDRKPFEVKYLAEFSVHVGKAPRRLKGLVSEFEAWLEKGLVDPEQPLRLALSPPEKREDERQFLESLVGSSVPELAADLRRLTPEEFLSRALSVDLLIRYRLDAEEAGRRLPLLPSPDQLEAYRRMAESVRAADNSWLFEMREAFEERIGENGYEALGLLTDSPDQLTVLIDKEEFFSHLAGHAARRLIRQIPHLKKPRLQQLCSQMGEPIPPRVPPRNLKESEQYRQLAGSLLWICSSLLDLEALVRRSASGNPLSLRKLERVFCDSVALMPWVGDSIRVFLEHLAWAELTDPDLQPRVSRSVDSFSQDYRRLIRASNARLPRVDGVLKSETPALVSRMEAESTRFVLVDALSWPLWKLLKAELEVRMPAQVRLVTEKVAYAYEPSRTLEQVSRWLAAGGPQPARKIQKGFAFPGNGKDSEVYGLDWIDEKVHSSRESSYFLYREIVQQLSPQITGLLARSPRRTLLVLFSDHGFTENPAFQPADKYRYPRYRHGGGSPFELVVPVAFFFCGGSGVGI